jgi:hypothetical protein
MGVSGWQAALRANPLDWLLEAEDPAVRHLALRQLLERPADDHDVVASRRAAMAADPIASILAAQSPDGFWEKPGPGYATKYRGTIWQLIFLDQLGADPQDERVARACEYVLSHTQAESGGFGASGVAGAGRPPSSRVIHCLTGNLLRALIGFGWLEDPRVVRAVEWQARAITGDGVARWYSSATCGPGFACAANERLPCAWGAVKALAGLARVPAQRRSREVTRAIEAGVDFLLSRDPAVADYPAGWGNTRPSGSWFKLGFPGGVRGGCPPEPRGAGRAGMCSGYPPGECDGMVAGQAGRARPLGERVRLPRQDLGRLRTAGTAQQVGDAASLSIPAVRFVVDVANLSSR